MADNDGRGSYGGVGGIGPQYGEITGSVLCQRQHDWGTGLRAAPLCAQCSQEVWSYKKCYKVVNNDMPTQSTTVRNIRGGDGLEVHGGGGVIP